MSSEHKVEITKENINLYLQSVAKEYRKLGGKSMPAEMVLIGGASVLINYGFRGTTRDIDALIHASSIMKDAIRRVSDQYGLPADWLNADFMQTDSYTTKLWQYASYYRTYANVLTVRTVAAEYLIAMKLQSGRRYKHDMSDVLGILEEHRKSGDPITPERIQKAFADLYGDSAVLSDYARTFMEQTMRDGDYAKLYTSISNEEEKAKEENK